MHVYHGAIRLQFQVINASLNRAGQHHKEPGNTIVLEDGCRKMLQ